MEVQTCRWLLLVVWGVVDRQQGLYFQVCTFGVWIKQVLDHDSFTSAALGRVETTKPVTFKLLL